MSRDSGWIVSRNGVWIPVAHNASVSETSDWKHASFESLDGTRRTAGRGRKPREWEITETVPYDWAQELYTLYITNDGLEPVFFIPPMAAATNIAPPLKNPNRMPLENSDKTTSWQMLNPTGIDTDFFPVRPGHIIEFGGRQEGSSIRLQLYKSDLSSLAGSFPVAGKGIDTTVSRKIRIDNMDVRWGRIISDSGTLVAQDRFARIVDVEMGNVRPYGPGGAWVTIDGFEINHGRQANRYSPTATIQLSLTECERV